MNKHKGIIPVEVQSALETNKKDTSTLGSKAQNEHTSAIKPISRRLQLWQVE